MSLTGRPPAQGALVWDGFKWVSRVLGAPNGIATLDEDGRIPLDQFPVDEAPENGVYAYGIVGVTNGETVVSGGGDTVAKVVFTSNVALTGDPGIVDGYDVQNADIALVAAQTTATQNGIYQVNLSGAWSRVTLTNGTNAAGARVFVDRGQWWRKTRWECISDDGAAVVGTNALVWRRVPSLLDDIYYDSNDVFDFIGPDEISAHPYLNRVPGGVAATLSISSGAGEYTGSVSGLETQIQPGPFGRDALQMRGLNGGARTASAAIDLPTNAFTLDCWVKPILASPLNSNGDALIFGRTRVAGVPTGLSASEYALFVGSHSSGSFGGLSEHGRTAQAHFLRTGQAAFDNPFTGVPSNVAQNNPATPNYQQWCIIGQVWNHLAVTFDGATFTYYINGNPLSMASAGTATGQGVGRFVLCGGNASGVQATGMPAFYCAFKLASTCRDQRFIKERYRRGIAWVGGG